MQIMALLVFSFGVSSRSGAQQTHHTCQCVQNEADVKTSAHSNALAKACAWVEQRGGWAGALLAGAAAVVGVELFKRAAGSALGPIMGHHAGAETGFGV